MVHFPRAKGIRTAASHSRMQSRSTTTMRMMVIIGLGWYGDGVQLSGEFGSPITGIQLSDPCQDFCRKSIV